ENAFDLKCRISSQLEQENILKITIENEITDKNSIEALRSVWNGNTPDTDKLINEGKSGYHKAFKILTSDLRCSKNECLKTSISEDEKWFTVSLSINVKDLTL